MRFSRRTSRFIVLHGGDGAGKSTQIQMLLERLPHLVLLSIEPRQIYPHHRLAHMSWTLEQHPREAVWRFPPYSRIAFYIQTFSQIMEVLWQEIEPGRTVLFDSYWYRTWAKEKLLNPEAVWLFEELVKRFPVPNVVIDLNVPPAVALRRKTSISRFESFDGTRQSFEDFQTRMLALCDSVIPASIRRAVSADAHLDKVHREIIDIVAESP